MPKIYVYRREVYGNELTYPYCEKAKSFARLTNTKTLSPDAINQIKALDFIVILVLSPTVPQVICCL